MTIELKVQPRARRAALELAHGRLKASVTAPPEDGKANAAVIDLLAEEWRLPKSTISVRRGAGSRTKLLGIDGNPTELAERIGRWMSLHG